MTDHEYAALAAGYKIVHKGTASIPAIKKHNSSFSGDKNDTLFWPAWNPLESDADAFRLMVDAEIYMQFCTDCCIEAYTDELSIVINIDSVDGFKHATTRKAIFDCAVAIGKAMETSND